MVAENEQSLQKRPDLVPEKLMRGGLIVGVEPGIQGSLMSVTGAAIERITRERTEVPPQFKLPERPVYFLDPNTRRLIMISNRENRGENKTPDKYGLFAEIVELDEEGKPHYRLSSFEIILPDDNYHLVAVGPNQFNLPPSHIEVEEESTESKEKRFVPWNVRLAELQNWMNQVIVNPDESLDDFLSRFAKLRAGSVQEVDKKIAQVFPQGDQGFDDRIVPINLIIAAQNQEELRQASIQAGLYPVIVAPDKMSKAIPLIEQDRIVEDDPSLGHILNPIFTKPAVITIDERVDWSRLDETLRNHMHSAREFFLYSFSQDSPRFAVVWLPVEEYEKENIKEEHGRYYSYSNEEYLGLLNKLKADLLLTMFLRGGAPIVK